MLARRASGAFVCLRCELNLARSRLSALPRRPPHASFSSAGRRRRDAFDDEFEKEKQKESDSNKQEKPVWRYEAQLPGPRVRRGRGGTAIREMTARLEGAKTLGEDASIIVLEELARRRKEPEIPEPVLVQNDNEIPLKLAEALADDKPVTLEEVVEQLDKLRQKATNDEYNTDEGLYVSQTVYMKLSNHLFKAFSSAQLSHYYSLRKGVEKERVPDKVREGLNQLQKRPSERSEWTPGVTQINRRLPSLDIQPRKKRKNVSKHLLVDQILRDVWKLIMLEELEATGEIELALKGWQLALLTSGHESALDRIGHARKAKLEASLADSVVRITADKHTAEYVADDVENMLQNSETLRFHFDTWIPHLESVDGSKPTIRDVFPDDVLATVTSLTGAQLQRSTFHIIIRALDKDTTAEAVRCLVKLLPLKREGLYSVDTTGRDALDRSQNFTPIPFPKEEVAYKLRSSNFGRWSLPIEKADAARPGSDSMAQRVKTAEEHVLSMTADFHVQEQTSSKQGKWERHPELRLAAQYGHALFELENSASGNPSFVPALPGLTSFFNHDAFHMSFATRPALSYEFIAQPGPINYTPDLLPYKFPRIIAQFRSAEGQQGLSKLLLKFDVKEHDVLLPEEAVDIRFRSYQVVHLRNANNVPSTRFLRERVQLNMQSGGQLTAPDLKLDIPKWTIEGMESGAKDDLISVRYQFAGVTFTQSVWGDHHGNTSSYSTGMSGKLGAKTGKFTTLYGVTRHAKKAQVDDHPSALKEFVANAFKTASRITEAAAATRTGPRKVEPKPKQEQASVPTAQSAEATNELHGIENQESSGSQTPEGAVNDLQSSDVPEDIMSSDVRSEDPPVATQEQPTEGEEKRDVESTS